MERLTKTECRAIKKAMETNPLWVFLYSTFKENRPYFETLQLSFEEVFVELIRIIDIFKKNPDERRFLLCSIWDREYYDLEEWYENHNSDGLTDEPTMGALLIVGFLYELLTLYDKNMAGVIVIEVVERQMMDEWRRLHDQVYNFNGQIMADDLGPYVEMYIDIDDEEFLSDEIDKILEDCKEESEKELEEAKRELQEAIKKKEEEEKESASPFMRFCSQQIIIFFDAVGHVELSAGHTNITKYSELLAAFSGYTPGSIRGTINKKLDYDNPKTKQDARELAEALKSFSPELDKIADKIIDLIS